MRRPQASISGMLVLVAVAAIVLVALSQSREQTQSALLTAALVAGPSVAIVLSYGSSRQRSFLKALAKFALATLASVVAASLLVLAAVTLIAAFTRPFDPLVMLAVATATATLLLASRAAWFERGPRRAFGVGAATLGWPFLLVGLAPIVSDRVPALATTEVAHGFYPHLYFLAYPEEGPEGATVRAEVPVPTFNGRTARPVAPSYVRFMRLGHCMMSLAIALAGGLTARAMVARRESSDDTGSDFESPAPTTDWTLLWPGT
jgi:hypothetical protein